MRKRLLFSLISVAICISACAPKVRDLNLDSGTMKTGPRLQDKDLGLDGKTPPAAQIAFDSDVTSATIFRMTENILSLKDSFNNQTQAKWATSLLSQMPHTRTKLSDSAYVGMMITQAKSVATTELDGILPKLNAEPKQIRHLIATLPSISTGTSLRAMVDGVFTYIKKFDASIASLGLLDQVATAIHQGLAPYLSKESSARSAVQAIESATTIQKTVTSLESALHEFGFSIPATELTMLTKIQKIGIEADRVTDSKTALAMLVDVWIFLTPAQRLQVFQSASADLYDYLNGMDHDDLVCVQNPDCASLPKWLAKTLVIYPKIDEYGVGHIRDRVNQSGSGAIRAQAAVALAAEIKKIPEILGDRIEAGIRAGLAPINRLQTDFSGEIKTRIDAWAKNGIEKTEPAVYHATPSRAHLTVDSAGHVAVQWTQMPTDTAENQGALSSLTPFLWQGGALSDVDARSLLLANVGSLAASYEADQSGSAPSLPNSVSARAYAETVRGYSAMAESFRDWQTNSFDTLLGGFTAQDLFPEFQISALNQKMFPKGAFYALSFQSLSDNLKTATGDHTQLFLVDAQNRITQPSDSTTDFAGASDSTPVMAGIADRIGDQLATHVRAEDVARYLIAMCGVLNATRSVEVSTSPYVLQKDSSGQVPRDEIIKSRDEIRLLILGLANYLSHQFRSGGELIYKEMVIATEQPTDSKVTVMDQALGIRALVAAADALGIELYRWEAIDLVSALNRNMYREDLGFYARPEETTVSPLALLETIRALDEVSPYLRPESRHQIDLLTAPWRSRISGWALGDAR